MRPTNLRIVDGAGEPVAPGEEGELLVRGPYTLNGYFRAERDNERSFDPDGFYRSGDLSADETTAIWWSPVGSRTSSAARVKRSPPKTSKSRC